jgi:hypothetical protein
LTPTHLRTLCQRSASLCMMRTIWCPILIILLLLN